MLRDLFLGCFATAGGVFFSQGPAFVQQYLQRLGGALRELERLVERTSRIEARIAELRTGYEALLAADPVAKPFVTLRYLKPEIALDTLELFEPALPLSLAGLLYGLVGIALAVLIFNLLMWPFQTRQQRARYS